MDTISWIWIITGAVALLAELVLPGGIIAFLGLSAILVGLGRSLGLLEGWMSQFMAWFILSLAMLLGLRGLVMRMAPGETSIESTDEDAALIGKAVEVAETVYPDNQEGRVRFQGTTWTATSMKEIIPAGAKARLAYRENMVWIIEYDPTLIEHSGNDEE